MTEYQFKELQRSINILKAQVAELSFQYSKSRGCYDLDYYLIAFLTGLLLGMLVHYFLLS